MDETNLEFMKNHNYTFESLFMVPLSTVEQKDAEERIDMVFKRWYRVDDIPSHAQWTWIDTYENVKMTLIHGSARLDDYTGENLDWWDERIHSGDYFRDHWGKYLSMRGFLMNLRLGAHKRNFKLEHNATTLAKAINRLFLHYIENEVEKRRQAQKTKTQSK